MRRKKLSRRQKRERKKKARATSTQRRASAKTTVDMQHLPPLPDRRSLEGTICELFGDGQTTAAGKAQQVMYRAWGVDDPGQRIALALEALEISPDCADAYVLLAEEAAESLEEVVELYRRGMEAGERTIGKQAFDVDAGHFWGILETRPYMRARAGLAESLWMVGEREEAVAHYSELLRLNPNDNQGIRDLLMPCLIELGRDAEAEKLFKQYEEDGMAVWMYSRALLDFRRHGASPATNTSLKAALDENKYVPRYLLGRKKMPRFLPDHYGFGDENEAVLYVHGNKAAWNATPGALEWLAAKVK